MTITGNALALPLPVAKVEKLPIYTNYLSTYAIYVFCTAITSIRNLVVVIKSNIRDTMSPQKLKNRALERF